MPIEKMLFEYMYILSERQVFILKFTLIRFQNNFQNFIGQYFTLATEIEFESS